jgi:subtilisin family serine protease
MKYLKPTPMEKTKKYTIYILSVAVIAALGIASWSIMRAQENSGEIKRIVIKPHNSEAANTIRGRSDLVVQHEFDDKFTAEVPVSAIQEISNLADVSEVVKLELLENETQEKNENAICGDGFIDPQEKCGETGLGTCTEKMVCWDCKCVNPNKPVVADRTCLPTKQREYSVTQLNGGQPGAGRDVKLAIVDTGIDEAHLDLEVKACKDMTEIGMRDGCEDTYGHGTHVAGIAGANAGGDQMGIYGVAPGVELWMMKVCKTGYCYDDDIAEGIRYAAKRGANIINISLGNPDPTPIIKEQIDAYPEVLFIAAAGNSGPTQGSIYYPAAYKEVVAVANIDSTKTVVRNSSRGITDGNDQVISDREVELSAGGYSVQSTFIDGCYRRLTGTSMSSPAIAGLAAKVWKGSAAATRAYLRNIAQDITKASGGGAGPGYDIASGYGLPVAPG